LLDPHAARKSLVNGIPMGVESRWGRHPILDRVGFLQLHESQAGYSGSNFLPVKPESIGEDRSLDHLTLLQVSLGPKASRVCYEMLGKPWMPSTSNASIFASWVASFGKGQLLAKLVALRLVGGSVYCLLVDEHLVEPVQLRSEMVLTQSATSSGHGLIGSSFPSLKACGCPPSPAA
jgi:hypothetical protein